MRLKLLLALLLALPGPLGAQAGPSGSSENRARSTASFVVKGGDLAGSARLHLGGWVGLVFKDRFALGGGGFGLTQEVELPGSGGGTGFHLGMGYGGLVLRLWEPLPKGLTGSAGVLLGAGHAKVSDRLSGREPGADNFFLVEPEISVSRPVRHGLHVGLSLGYRKVWGVEDLPRVSDQELNSFTGSLSLRIGGI